MSDRRLHLTLPLRVTRLLYEHANVSLFLCEDETTGERVVVKQVAPGGDETPTSSDPSTECSRVDLGEDGLVRELLAAKRLIQDTASRLSPHPHVVRYLNVQPPAADTPAFLTMEFCPNGDLFSLLEQQPDGFFHEQQALTIFKQVADGVHYLHSLGIAHRDISMENVLLDAQGRAKICDFGLSTSATSPCCEQVGKLQYMAPEVVSGAVYDPVRADVWSLGILLFIMLTGSPLFAVADPTDPAWKALQRVGVAGILVRWQMASRVSPATTQLLASLLSLDPQARPKSVSSVRDHVRELLALQ